ncbi:MAG: glycosyltransferase [Cyanobium sp.]|jgi:glycosyltransferase involved in cell wall biosynthesis
MITDKPRLLYLSRTPLSKVSGATLAMRRHLVHHHDFDTYVITTEANDCSDLIGLRLLPPFLLQRARNTRFNRVVHNAELLLQPLFSDSRINSAAAAFQPDAIFTVADLTLSEAARKLAHDLKLPLIVNFQDWWPRGQFYSTNEIPYRGLVPILESRFRRLFRSADLVFCTSEGMRNYLGTHPNSHVLYPIGDDQQPMSVPQPFAPTPALDKHPKRQLIYTGTAFGSYGQMLLQLAEALKDHTHWDLVIYGKRPDWPAHTIAAAERSGLYRGFLPFEQLRAVLAAADACLSVMSFDPDLEVMMRTSFTTKVLDYCSAGRPILMWGPPFCSPIRLLQRRQAALTVTTPDPARVIACLERLERDHRLSADLGRAALALADGELSHASIHGIFVREIQRLLVPAAS